VAHHGARSSPVTNFNTSKVPWDKNHKSGELTNVGLREGYLLGRVLREKYMHKADILNEKYDDYQIVVKAAPYNAAVMSANAQAMGFYTPGVGDVLTEMEQEIAQPPVEDPSVFDNERKKVLMDMGLPYYTQVLPIHYSEGGNDWIFSTLSECNIIKNIWVNVTNSSEYKALEEKYQELYKTLTAQTGINFTSMIQAYLLYDDVICDLADDRSLNDKFNFDPDTMDTLRNLVIDVWKHLIFGDARILKAVVTPIFREWITLFNNVVADDNQKQKKDNTLNFALYVSDASLLLPIMNMYGVTRTKPFEFADNFILQMGVKSESVSKMKKELSDYEVVVFFNGVAVEYRGNLWISAEIFVRMLVESSLLHLSNTEFIDWCASEPYVPPTPPPAPEKVSYKWVIISLAIEVGLLILIFAGCYLLNKNKGVISTTNNEVPADALGKPN
jgi:hypothetical protein